MQHYVLSLNPKLTSCVIANCLSPNESLKLKWGKFIVEIAIDCEFVLICVDNAVSSSVLVYIVD